MELSWKGNYRNLFMVLLSTKDSTDLLWRYPAKGTRCSRCHRTSRWGSYPAPPVPKETCLVQSSQWQTVAEPSHETDLIWNKRQKPTPKGIISKNNNFRQKPTHRTWEHEVALPNRILTFYYRSNKPLQSWRFEILQINPTVPYLLILKCSSLDGIQAVEDQVLPDTLWGICSHASIASRGHQHSLVQGCFLPFPSQKHSI